MSVVVPFPLDCDMGQTLVMLTLRRSTEPCKGFTKALPTPEALDSLFGRSVSQSYLAYTSQSSPGSFSHGQDGRVEVLEEEDHEKSWLPLQGGN